MEELILFKTSRRLLILVLKSTRAPRDQSQVVDIYVYLGLSSAQNVVNFRKSAYQPHCNQIVVVVRIFLMLFPGHF